MGDLEPPEMTRPASVMPRIAAIIGIAVLPVPPRPVLGQVMTVKTPVLRLEFWIFLWETFLRFLHGFGIFILGLLLIGLNKFSSYIGQIQIVRHVIAKQVFHAGKRFRPNALNILLHNINPP
uniref:hypothetical protein n=1 Tax=Pararhizobium sp. IMCC3301 TaxID=3067904 RepID=UPI0027415D3B|nr:hypothetical protein [Pararhizobium sp. IMCC3301]